MEEKIIPEKTLKITEEVADESEDEIVEKPKRKPMTDKQKEALARGRKLAQQKRREEKEPSSKY